MTTPQSEQLRPKLTLWQRMAVRKLRREAGRKGGEPLAPEDWVVAWRLHDQGFGGVVNAILRAASPKPSLRRLWCPLCRDRWSDRRSARLPAVAEEPDCMRDMC
jgi:hypothetical protein